MSVELQSQGPAGARIAAELRLAILAGEHAPGARVREEDLANRHGASRGPVREALRMLDGEGLITLVANKGAWVSKISRADCEEMYQMRERVEPLLLRVNVPLLADERVKELDRLAVAMEASIDVEEFLALDREFHLSQYTAADTTVLGDTVTRLWNRTQHYRRAFTRLLRTERDSSVHRQHHLLVSAIRRRDLDESERVLADHIRRTRLVLARNPDVLQ